jgi:hypothetical protein
MEELMQAELTIWHNRRDTLVRIVDGMSNGGSSVAARPRLEQVPGAAPYYSVYIPIGISPGTLRRHNVTVEYRIDRSYPAAIGVQQQAYQHWRTKTYMRVGLDEKNPRGGIRRLTPDYLAHLRYIDPRKPDPKRIRPYLEIDRIFRTQPEYRRPDYYEAALHFIPRGARLQYRIKVYSKSRMPATIPPRSWAGPDTDWYELYVVAPAFTREDITYCSSLDADPNARPAVRVPDSSVGYWAVPDVNVGYWTESSVDGKDDLLSFRFDFVDVRRAINDFELEFRPPPTSAVPAAGATVPAVEPNRLTFAWLVDSPRLDLAARKTPIASKWHLPSLPVISEQFDYVTFTVPRASIPDGYELIWRGRAIATMRSGKLTPNELPTVRPIRLMFIHYANQSLNDLFESPNKSYAPPRSYIQTTMRDELGTFSSRPSSNETGIGDGYDYVFERHREYKLPAIVAMNGGFLAMLAQDARGDFRRIVDGIKAGFFEPAIGGWAGHRMLYFTEETNRAPIQYGIDLFENLLPGTGRVFHPNSRLYAATSNIDGAISAAKIRRPLRRAEGGAIAAPSRNDSNGVGVQFVVADASAFRAHMPPLARTADRKLWGAYEHCYIWRQRCRVHRDSTQDCTAACDTWYWLFIDAQKMKDGLFGASEDEWRAGKLFWQVRYHLFYGVSDPAVARDSLLIYGDDIDHAAANGWFDGDYNGPDTNNAAVFAAALEWIAAHPWLQVVVSADLEPEQECVGTIFVRDAIDPFIHKDVENDEHGHALPGPAPTYWSDGGPSGEGGTFDFDRWADVQIHRRPDELGFEYARWYRKWRETEAIWLDRSLGAICREVERAVMDPALATTRNELERLAQLAFLIAIHEAHWSKKPLEPHITADDLEREGPATPYRSAFRRPEVLEPENFVLALSLQSRNAYVLQCAARWAELPRSGANGIGDETLKNTGPLIDEIRAMRARSGVAAPPNGTDPGLHWDLDVTESVILYNRHLLVVMDSNGGRVTHIFGVGRNGRPVVISGNIKSYQFLGDDRQHGGQLACNGSVFQNTVLVPNHRYVASDVRQAQPQAGSRFNPKTRVESVQRDGGTVATASSATRGCTSSWRHTSTTSSSTFGRCRTRTAAMRRWPLP